MAERDDELLAAREHVRPDWSPDRAARLEAALDARQRHPRRGLWLAGAGVGAVMVVVGIVILLGGPRTARRRAPGQAAVSPVPSLPHVSPASPPARPPSPAPVPARPRRLTLGDGSTIDLVDQAEAVVREQTSARVVIALEHGTGLFEIVHDPARRLTVDAGDVRVRVVGTSFTVGRASDGVEVLVHDGRVVVEAAGRRPRELVTGERAWFPAGTPTVTAPIAPSPVSPDAAAAPPPDWRAEARQGRFAQAWAELAAAPPDDAPRDPDELLLAADAARLSGHAVDAVPLLARLCDEHPGDVRAPLAAFTLGRVQLELGRPLSAATSFALARALAPTGPLAADALAREAEAWREAGDPVRAGERAREYLRVHPEGSRAPWMRPLAEGPR